MFFKTHIPTISGKIHLYLQYLINSKLYYSIILSSIIITPSLALAQQEHVYTTDNARYQLQLRAPKKIELNKIYHWQARLISNKQSLKDIDLNKVIISGGMPAHRHGLPTQPIATNLIGLTNTEVHFTIKGLKFQMWGAWYIQVQLNQHSEPLVINFKLAP